MIGTTDNRNNRRNGMSGSRLHRGQFNEGKNLQQTMSVLVLLVLFIEGCFFYTRTQR